MEKERGLRKRGGEKGKKRWRRKRIKQWAQNSAHGRGPTVK